MAPPGLLRRDDLAADALGDQVDVEDRVRAHHVDVAVDALQLVVEVVHRRAARLHDLAHDVAALVDDVRDAEAKVQLAELVEIDATVGVGLHAIGDVAHQRLGEVDLDAQVGQPHLRGHAGALRPLGAEHHAVEQALLEEGEGSLGRAHRGHGGGEGEERRDRDPVQVGIAGLGEHVRRRHQRHAPLGHDDVGDHDVAAAGRRHAVDVPGVLHLDLVDGQQEVAGRIHRVALDLPAHQHPVGVADAGAEGPVARQRVGAVAGGDRSAARVHAAGGEHEGLRAEDLVLEVLGEHREQPVVLHVEGGDPAHRRIGLGDRQPDVDVGRHVDLVAAVPLRRRTTGTPPSP